MSLLGHSQGDIRFREDRHRGSIGSRLGHSQSDLDTSIEIHQKPQQYLDLRVVNPWNCCMDFRRKCFVLFSSARYRSVDQSVN